MSQSPVLPGSLVKSAARVRDLGEVFTPAVTVNEILAMLPANVWAIHPSPNFLEPACGDGNFMVVIFQHKLDAISKSFGKKKLPAGNTIESAQFHAIEALASIYAIDLSLENIVGGKPAHEVGARERLLAQFREWNKLTLSTPLNKRSLVLRAANWIVEHNILVGNMLAVDINGKKTGRDQIPIIEYSFYPETLNVELFKTTMGDVIDSELQSASSQGEMFGPVSPVPLWKGKAFNVSEADYVLAPKPIGPLVNGKRSC